MAIYTMDEISENSISADYCIIGAGFAGLFTARKLAQHGKKVVILESGVKQGDPDFMTLSEVDDETGKFTPASESRERGFGGQSRQWGGRFIPLSPHDMGPRPHIGCEEWPISYEEIDSYRREVEKIFSLPDTSYEEEVGRKELGLDKLLPWDEKNINERYPKWATFSKMNLARLLRGEFENNDHIKVWLNATVVDYVFDSEKGLLTAVKARSLKGATLEVHSRFFVVTAGPLESTRILLNLDRASKHRAFEKCQALGHYAHDHLGLRVGDLDVQNSWVANRWFGYYLASDCRRSLHLETTPQAQEKDRAASGFSHVIMDIPEDAPLEVIKNFLRGLQGGKIVMPLSGMVHLAANMDDLFQMAWWQLRYKQLFMAKKIGLGFHVWIEQVPNFNSKIVLSDKVDRLSVPRAKLECIVSDQDERTIRSVINRTKSYWQSAGLEKACPIKWRKEVEDSSFQLASLSQSLIHPYGSTRMGKDSMNSVVNSNLACHHLPNVYVCSGSVFPTAGSANPTMTVMQLALRLGNHLAEQ